MIDDFFENLQKATSNIEDIAYNKYAEVTEVNEDKVNCKQTDEDNGLTHTDVPITNNLQCEVGDYVILSFMDNSLYNPVVVGKLNPPTSSGGGSSVIGTGSFTIKEDGHLWVELPNGVDNPYYINESGHLIYDTSNAHNGS